MTQIRQAAPDPEYDHPLPHDSSACASSMLTEIAAGYFPDLDDTDTDQPRQLYKLINAAGGALASFAQYLCEGRHGSGCIRRQEEEAAELVNALGWQPVCRTCGESVHLFPGIAGWQHYRMHGTAGAALEFTEPGHLTALTWRAPGSGKLAADADYAGQLGADHPAAIGLARRAPRTCAVGPEPGA
jgi:hypothetical protein